MRESEFQKKLQHQLRDVGALVFNVHGHTMQQSGWPDLQVYHTIWTGHLELKLSAKVEQHQHFIINELRRRGTAAFALRLAGDDLILEGFGRWTDFCLWAGNVQAKSLLLGLRDVSIPIWDRRSSGERFLEGVECFLIERS